MKGRALCAMLTVPPHRGKGGTVMNAKNRQSKAAPAKAKSRETAPREPPRSTYVRRCTEARGARGLKHYG